MSDRREKNSGAEPEKKNGIYVGLHELDWTRTGKEVPDPNYPKDDEFGLFLKEIAKDAPLSPDETALAAINGMPPYSDDVSPKLYRLLLEMKLERIARDEENELSLVATAMALIGAETDEDQDRAYYELEKSAGRLGLDTAEIFNSPEAPSAVSGPSQDPYGSNA